jgi:hypothetical protein
MMSEKIRVFIWTYCELVHIEPTALDPDERGTEDWNAGVEIPMDLYEKYWQAKKNFENSWQAVEAYLD